MKYLPLLILGLLISFIFFLFPTGSKASTFCAAPGETCEYFRADGRYCQGVCPSNLICGPASANDYCFPTAPTPTPTATLAPPPSQTTGIITGVQIPLASTVKRIIPSQYGFQWVKFQYSLGSTQDLEGMIRAANSGGGKSYQALISVAKNEAHIPQLLNPPYPEMSNGHPAFTQDYCPWDDELDRYTEGTGEFHQCGTDALGNPEMCEDTREVTVPARAGNGYLEFRDAMQALASRLNGAGAVEIWNEPNLEDEWTAQGLGPVSPENYVNFMNCGIKGLRKGGYSGKVISAGLAPNAYATATGQTNMNDLDFFNRFIAAKGTEKIDAIGWHSNVTSNISPTSTDENGFQRVRHALGNGKPVWLTEYGWDRSTFHLATDFEDRQLQAQYVSQAIEVAKANLTGIEGMFVWNFGWTKDIPEQRAFIPWDIEGTVPQGLLCQPNPRRENVKDRGDTTYVQDKSLTDDVAVASIAGVALLPRTITDEVNRNLLNLPGTDVEVTKSFFSELLNFLSFIQNFFCSTLGRILGLGDYCTPNLSVGIAEAGSKPPGKNTQQFTEKSKILGAVAIPEGMALKPEDKDCNLGQIQDPSKGIDEGNKKLNELSETMGTTTGFYGNNMIDFKSVNLDDWEKCMSDRMKSENLNIGNKLFEQDRRSADLYCRKLVMCKSLYPNGICPFEPSPTPNL